ncbi:MAG: hypothetical protein CMD99_07910 [Gammaproteobacteria bacterium]|nr:hypothetical protein [Gammaproteobacteria bacterium]
MIGSIDSSADGADFPEEITEHRLIEPGPIFKEIYSGIVDMENPEEWRPLLQREARSFLSHTTDINTFEQFKTIHQIPQKRGTAFHHKAYLAALESLSV